MESRVAVISIIVEELESAVEINNLLHDYAKYIILRVGAPYEKRNISIISVALDAPQDEISTLSGKLGKLKGVSVKTAYSSCKG